MRKISYAQNLEDIMLYRAFESIGNGFYVDIGANHPTKDSVTKLFYENGWTGINVEPEEEYFKLLKSEREADININAAITSIGEQVELFVSDVRGWSTTDKNSLSGLEEKGSLRAKKIVPAMSLDKLFDKYVEQDVHFLKIDVEGAEKDVLESFSFERVRPWVIVVEATKPTTKIDVSHTWEGILTRHNYTFVYFDGLNKFYVAQERPELSTYFSVPPNVFDDFIRIEEHSAIIEIDLLSKKLEQEKMKVNMAEVRLQDILNSNSWKITAPIRYLISKFKGA
ncbi:FkbM family methyltransferase [Vibrio cholerae]|uniref:FkbM family methyltransferase n=1 Tax=Vibrio cholerae TaxID=666 RepID=UPI0011D621E7|nr:FkbM family methyltransferase [Vibrio cholerae]EGR0581295.1 FkbM family methyltransferase [Vibrio cholerae]TXY76641.1 FkbM family methyltransferase [Vibrio cholerae]BCN21216.1 putative monosaccharide biosynthesis protein [Vibrio cholerae]BCN21879.1 putative monosaccharide biosynthesis protein [Vibrio cholerae]GHX92005.1 hypothetical protein VCSRO67_2412 [Vibrio cholerae]